MLVHRRSFTRNLLGFPNNLPVPIYTPRWREALWELSVLPKNTTQCPRPGLEPGSLVPGTSALTMRPPRLPNRKARPMFPQYGSHVCSMTYTLCNAGSEVIKMLVRDDQRGRCRRVITWLNSLKYSGTNRAFLTPYTGTWERIGHYSTPYCHLCRSNPLCILDWKKEATPKLSILFLRSL